MKEILKNELRRAYAPPPPLRKKEFLRELELPGMSMAEFIFSQIGYIRKWVWGISALIFMLSLTGSVILSVDMLWVISAFTPVLALTMLSERGRSESHGMAELELATRFSLRSVLFARSGILGMENLVLLFLLVPVGLLNNTFTPIQAGVYIIAPFMLTAFTGLYIVRRLRGREAMYLCAGAAACISFSVFFFRMTFPQIYQVNQLVWWIAAILLLCIGTAVQYYKGINDVTD